MSAKIIVGELPGFSYPRIYHPEKKIDRSGKTVADYFEEQGIMWGPASSNSETRADIWIRKVELSVESPRCEEDERRRIEKTKTHPTLLLLHENQESAPVAYRLADPQKSLAVAPGKNLQRLFDRAEWVDPQLENWKKRSDRLCWIGRPTEARIEFAKKLLDQGVALDIFSADPWPLSCWKGRAESDIEAARDYQYRIVFETSQNFLCHSEKLFLSLLSGCVSFYMADPDLELPWVKSSFLNWSDETWKNRGNLAPAVLESMSQFLFSSAWEIYSYREYYNQIILAAFKIPEVVARIAERPSSKITRTPFIDYPESKKLFDEGAAFLSANENAKAASNFEKVDELLGPIFFVQLHLGVAKMRLGQFEEAETLFREGLERFPSNHECLVNLGVLRTRQNKNHEAIKIFEEVLSIYPMSGIAWRNLGRCYLQENRLQEALKTFESGIEVCPYDSLMKADLANVNQVLASQN